jgi:hypothetical protein
MYEGKSSDGMIVRFWIDGRLTLGPADVYAGSAKYERHIAAEILRWVDTFTAAEIQEMCRTGRFIS